MTREQYLKQRNALMTESENLIAEGKYDEASAKMKEVENLDNQWENAKVAMANMAALKGAVNPVEPVLENTSLTGEKAVEDPTNTVEYRKAFMNYCITGEKSPLFKNVDEFSTTVEADAVIPTTIVEEVIQNMKVRGNIFERVRMLSIKGGVDVPISSIKPVASWVAEGTPSDRQKVDMSTAVSFNYYGLECRVAVSLVASATTLQIFENTIIELIVEAMLKALDIAVIKGTGTGQPLGITVDPRIPAGNVITLAAADFITWEGWKKKVFAKIPLAYRAGGSFTMAAGTWEGYIDGMVDANGQPMARVNYGINDATQERFGGRDVILVEDDVIAPYEAAATDDIVAVYCKYSDYAINSNMQMAMFRWLDHDTNQWVDKAMLIADGKILDPNGVLIIKKGL